MAENQITRDVYRQYAHKIVSVLKNEEFYEQFKKRVDKGSSNFKLAKKRLIQDISIDWIDTIEEILPNLDTIVRNPRKFIVQEEDIVDVSLARSISTESVKFLAQHTNMISKVDKDGMVTPSKILNITKEESFEIYENRFIYTLLLKLKDFVTMRYDKIKKASATQDVLELDVESRFNLPSKKVTFRTEYFAQLSFDEVMRLDPDTLTKIERVAKIDRIITDFLSSSFAKSMRNSAPVRPPIMRTNVILKEPNFKKALTLWQFIETYNATGGFSTSDEVENYDIETDNVDNLKNMVTLNTMIFESMYEQHETDMDMEDKEFSDFLRVGDMDFQKDELNRDEYAQKLDDELKDEEDRIEDVTPQENEEAETSLDEERQPEDKTQESDAETPQNQERQPEVEEREKDKEKEIIQEVEVEKPVEVERLKEIAPKADQEEVDLDADVEKFDRHLYEVRKLYKRPDDDKLKQEDIAKVKDAVDRCLISYRRIKQEEIDERVRQERIRHRIAEMEKRAAAFAKHREDLEKNADLLQHDATVHYGIDPFGYQMAKLAEAKREEELLAERRRMLEEANKAKESDSDITESESAEECDSQNEIIAEIDETATCDVEAESIETEPSEENTYANENSESDAEQEKTDVDEISDITETDSEAEPAVDETATDSEDVAESDAEMEEADVQPVQTEIPEEDKPSENKETETDENPQSEIGAEEESAVTQGESVPEQPAPKRNKRKKSIEPVDEKKVAVGGIRFKDGFNINDPFGMLARGRKAENKSDDEHHKSEEKEDGEHNGD